MQNDYHQVISEEIELNNLMGRLGYPIRCSRGWVEKLSQEKLVLFWRLFDLEYKLYVDKTALVRVRLLENEAVNRGIFFDLLKLYRKYEENVY